MQSLLNEDSALQVNPPRLQSDNSKTLDLLESIKQDHLKYGGDTVDLNDIEKMYLKILMPET